MNKCLLQDLATFFFSEFLELCNRKVVVAGRASTFELLMLMGYIKVYVIVWVLFIYLFIYLFICLHPWRVKVPRPGIECEPQQ